MIGADAEPTAGPGTAVANPEQSQYDRVRDSRPDIALAIVGLHNALLLQSLSGSA